jgi:hypothetical protein
VAKGRIVGVEGHVTLFSVDTAADLICPEPYLSCAIESRPIEPPFARDLPLAACGNGRID